MLFGVDVSNRYLGALLGQPMGDVATDAFSPIGNYGHLSLQLTLLAPGQISQAVEPRRVVAQDLVDGFGGYLALGL